MQWFYRYSPPGPHFGAGTEERRLEALAQHPNRWDQAGIFLSAACVVHCVLTPFLLLLLPSLQAFSDSELTHQILAVVLPLVALFAFVPGYKQHRNPLIFGLGFLGLGFIVFAAIDPYGNLHGFREAIVTTLGSACLITAHLKNRKLLHCCGDHCHQQKSAS